MMTKKLSARQARWAEFLSQFHFKLTYQARKANERADALSCKTEDVQDQKEIMDHYHTQTMLPRNKLD
jgi:hypothetical protein